MAFLLVSAPVHVRAAGQTVDGWAVSQSAGSIQVTLRGMWHNGCGADPAQVSIAGDVITILVPPRALPLGTGCTQVFTPWTQTVSLGSLPDAGYTVRVTTYGAPEPPASPATIATFTFVVSNGIVLTGPGVPAVGWQALLLCCAALLGIARGRLRA